MKHNNQERVQYYRVNKMNKTISVFINYESQQLNYILFVRNANKSSLRHIIYFHLVHSIRIPLFERVFIALSSLNWYAQRFFFAKLDRFCGVFPYIAVVYRTNGFLPHIWTALNNAGPVNIAILILVAIQLMVDQAAAHSQTFHRIKNINENKVSYWNSF